MTYKIQIDDLVRNATPDETAEIDALRTESDALIAAAAAKAEALASARAKLAALGLTADEIAAFLG